MNNDRIILEGEVIDACRSIFKIRVNENHIVSATLSGKIRQSGIKVLNGDRVKVEVSPFDISKGRIVFRMK